MSIVGLPRIPWSWGSKIADQFRRDLLLTQSDKFTGRVLDLGCGRRPHEGMLGVRAARWIGIDLPVTHSGPSHADVYASGMAVPFRDESFDVVLCTEVIEHVPEPDRLFSEVARVLREGGFLILTAPQAHVLHEIPHDYFRFTRYGLAHLARKNGLTVESVKAFGGILALTGQQLANHIPLINKRRSGQALRAVVQAGLQWLFWHSDRWLHRFHDGAEESTIGNLLVAQKVGRVLARNQPPHGSEGAGGPREQRDRPGR